MHIRRATLDDAQRLQAIDRATWSWDVTPVPLRDDDFFSRDDPGNTLVAEVDGVVAGYVMLRPSTPLESSKHVLLVAGLAVDPAHQGQGLGRRLLEAVVDEAGRRGARRLTLRVLGGNERARRLYSACGFEVEGVLREHFRLDGRYVDDVFMARTLSAGHEA